MKSFRFNSALAMFFYYLPLLIFSQGFAQQEIIFLIKKGDNLAKRVSSSNSNSVDLGNSVILLPSLLGL